MKALKRLFRRGPSRAEREARAAQAARTAAEIAFRARRDAADDAQRAGRWSDAARLYVETMALLPGEAEGLHMQVGHVLKEAGDFTGAESHYRCYLAQHPDDPDAYVQLGHLFNRQDRASEALDWYSQLQARVPADHPMAIDAAHAIADLNGRAVRRVRARIAALIAANRPAEAIAFAEEQARSSGEQAANLVLAYASIDRAAAFYDAQKSHDAQAALGAANIALIQNNPLKSLIYLQAARHLGLTPNSHSTTRITAKLSNAILLLD